MEENCNSLKYLVVYEGNKIVAKDYESLINVFIEIDEMLTFDEKKDIFLGYIKLILALNSEKSLDLDEESNTKLFNIDDVDSTIDILNELRIAKIFKVYS